MAKPQACVKKKPAGPRAWKFVYERCIHEKPNADAFADMKSSPMSTDAVTGYVIRAVAKKTTD